jgi:ketosteroid isomerase-like protein
MGTQENREIARRYHDFRPEEVDQLLTPDFVGRHRPRGDGEPTHTWNREQHKQWLTKQMGKQKHTVHEQIAEGDWVATRYTIRFEVDGKRKRADLMQFKHFRGGKIADLWEYYDAKQVEEDAP